MNKSRMTAKIENNLILRKKFVKNELERDFESFKIGLLLKKAREEKHLTQSELAELVDKKREYISRVENNVGIFMVFVHFVSKNEHIWITCSLDPIA